MVLLMGITLPAGVEIIYNKQIRMYDVSIFCNVGKNPRWFPRAKKHTLKEITYLYQIAYAWANFSQEVKDAWASAGDVIGQHGYNLFVQDKSYRIKNEIVGNATPSIYHQFLVGHINVSAPASNALIAQYNSRRLDFPASFELCFKTNLTASGADPYAKLKFTWTRYYQGQNIDSEEVINLPLSQAWTKEEKAITEYEGIRGKWKIELELNDVVGDIWFDNIMVEYSGEIKLNDPYCMDVERWWRAVDLPSGATLETVYPVGGAL